MKKNLACLSLALVLGLNSAAWSANGRIASPQFGPKAGAFAMRNRLQHDYISHAEIFATLNSMGMHFSKKLETAVLELSNLKLSLKKQNPYDDSYEQYKVQRDMYVSRIDKELDHAEISRLLAAKMNKFADDAASKHVTVAQLNENWVSMSNMAHDSLDAYLPKSMNGNTFFSIFNKTYDRRLAMLLAEDQLKINKIATALNRDSKDKDMTPFPTGSAPKSYEADTQVITDGNGGETYSGPSVQLGPHAASHNFTFKIGPNDRRKGPPPVYPSSQEKPKASSKEIPLTPAKIDKKTDSIVTGNEVFFVTKGSQFSVGHVATVEKIFADGTALVQYGGNTSFARVSKLAKSVSQFRGISVGDEVLYTTRGRDFSVSHPAVVKKLFANGTALVQYGGNTAFEHVSKLVKKV